MVCEVKWIDWHSLLAERLGSGESSNTRLWGGYSGIRLGRLLGLFLPTSILVVHGQGKDELRQTFRDVRDTRQNQAVYVRIR
jgi:hypothetical protein